METALSNLHTHSTDRYTHQPIWNCWDVDLGQLWGPGWFLDCVKWGPCYVITCNLPEPTVVHVLFHQSSLELKIIRAPFWGPDNSTTSYTQVQVPHAQSQACKNWKAWPATGSFRSSWLDVRRSALCTYYGQDSDWFKLCKQSERNINNPDCIKT